MSELLAIDPGYSARGRGCACALFFGSVLTRVWFARPETASFSELSVGADHVIWECPQVDRRTRGSVPSTVTLAAVGGTMAGLFAGANRATCEPVSPAIWKGSAPKPIHHSRMWGLLRDCERELLGGERTLEGIERAKRKGALDRWSRSGSTYYPSSWLEHNLLDAAGLGLWKLGRKI